MPPKSFYVGKKPSPNKIAIDQNGANFSRITILKC